MGPEIVIPALGIIAGISVPLGVFVWLYLESKDKNKTILEISKNIDDPSKLEDLVSLLDERKKEPIDYRRSGVVTLFVGIGLFLFGVFFLGEILKVLERWWPLLVLDKLLLDIYTQILAKRLQMQ
jgi:hypothetical protein